VLDAVAGRLVEDVDVAQAVAEAEGVSVGVVEAVWLSVEDGDGVAGVVVPVREGWGLVVGVWVERGAGEGVLVAVPAGVSVPLVVA
jgi:hypothetical protein